MASRAAAILRVREPDVLWRSGSFGVTLLPPRCEQPVTLDGTGAQLWAALAQPRTDAELAELLATTFDATPERVGADIAPVLDELERIGAITAVRPPAGAPS